MVVDPELVVPDDQKSISAGAISPWSAAHVSDYFSRLLDALAEELGSRLDTPWARAPAAGPRSRPRGHPTKLHVRYKNRYGRERSYYAQFEGVIPYIERRHGEAETDTSRERFEGFMREVPVPGLRRRPAQADLAVRSPSAARTSPRSARCRSTRPRAFLSDDLDLTARERQIAERVVKEINERLRFLLDVGLDYLTLNRPSGSLSGGEAQRIRLATQIGAGLVGVLYVLDEPSIGLHQRDNHRLIETLVRLRDLGNTLIVVEHDEDTIRACRLGRRHRSGRGRARRSDRRLRTGRGPATTIPTR